MSKTVPTTANLAPGNSLLRGLVILSLSLNAFLATWLLRPVSRGAVLERTTVSRSRPAMPSALKQPAANNRQKLAGHSTLPFDWRQIESKDYRQYAINLRAIGCPGQTLVDIISADLNQLYGVKANAIWAAPAVGEFWQKSSPRIGPSQEQSERLRTLQREKLNVLEQVTGERVPIQRQVNVLFMQPDEGYTSLAFLPEDKREAAYLALCEAKLANRSRPEDTREEEQRSQKAQVAALSGVLSANELEEFQMRTDRGAWDLRSYLQYFECTPDEFKTLVQVREEINSATNAPKDPYLRMAEEAAAFAKHFGEDRGREYAEKADLFYVWARRAAERYDLPDDVADRAWVIKRDAISTAQQVSVDTTLTTDERRQQVEALQRITEGKLIEVLGAKGAAIARRGDWWLQFPTMDLGR